VIAGVWAYNSHLRWTQWIGVLLIIGTVTLLPVQRRRDLVKLTARDAALAGA
jgi:lauroyl/myristoyl acyltransferase